MSDEITRGMRVTNERRLRLALLNVAVAVEHKLDGDDPSEEAFALGCARERFAHYLAVASRYGVA